MVVAAMMTGYDRDRPRSPGPGRTREHNGKHRAVPVFDRARAESPIAEQRIGLQIHASSVFGAFRETHRRPPREVVTAVFMGDPAPDRVVPDIPDDQDARVRKQPAPIHLTFVAMRAAYEDDAP